MKKFIKRKNKGFTLVELILISSIVSLAIIAIYTVYNKKSIDALVKTQTMYLEQISNGINASFNSTNNLGLVTVPNVIASRIVPEAMIQSATEVRSIFGGNVNFNGAAGTPNTFGIILDNIPADACTLLSTTTFASNAREVIINGTSVKGVNTAATSTSVSDSATQCTLNTNTIEFRNPIVVTTSSPIINIGSNRARENPYYIPTVGNSVASPGVACTGGSSWNGSFCGCSSGSEWDGSSCVVYGSRPGACPMGQGWDGTSCINHSVPSSGGAYVGGRTLPNVGYTGQVQQTFSGSSCHPSSVTSGNFDTQTCQTCANGTWDGFRCVPP